MNFNDKKFFRKEALRARDALTLTERVSFSDSVRKNLQSLEVFQQSKIVMSYMSFRSEVITDEIIRSCLAMKKRIVVPISIPENRTLRTVEVTNFDEDFETDFYGIRIPKKENGCEVSVSDIDLVLVPGVAFSLERYRMGYGAGYYDRFLEKLRSDAVAIALAFETQIYEDIPKERHDKKMHCIITERRIL